MNKNILALISGGLNSITALQSMLELDYVCDTFIWFNYGQKHYNEKDAALKLAMHYELQMIEIEVGGMFASNALTDSLNYSEDTFVPGLTPIMISMTAALALKFNCNHIVGGWHSTHYPHHSKNYFTSAQTAINISLGSKYKIDIHTPLVSLPQSTIITEAVRLDIPAEKTWACYAPIQSKNWIHVQCDNCRACSTYQGICSRPKRKYEYTSCGECATCILRIKAFTKAGYIDPLKYKPRKD